MFTKVIVCYLPGFRNILEMCVSNELVGDKGDLEMCLQQSIILFWYYSLGVVEIDISSFQQRQK